MGAHIVEGGFKSDKYEWCPPGFVPLKLTDKAAQDLLWEYAQRRREVDAEFSDDLEVALRGEDFEPMTSSVIENLSEELKNVSGRASRALMALAMVSDNGTVVELIRITRRVGMYKLLGALIAMCRQVPSADEPYTRKLIENFTKTLEDYKQRVKDYVEST